MREPEFLEQLQSPKRPALRCRLRFPRTDRKQKAAMAAMTLTLVIVWARMMAGSATPPRAHADLTPRLAPDRTGIAGDPQIFSDAIQKSDSAPADQKIQSDGWPDLRRQIIDQSQLLRLQGTMLGPSPMALINGQLVGLNGVVRVDLKSDAGGSAAPRCVEYKVVEISALSVIVECDQIRLLVSFR